MNGTEMPAGLNRHWRITGAVAASFVAFGLARTLGWPEAVVAGHPTEVRSIVYLAGAAVAVSVAVNACDSIAERWIWWSGAARLALPLWGWAPAWRTPGSVTAITVALDFLIGGLLAFEAARGYATVRAAKDRYRR